MSIVFADELERLTLPPPSRARTIFAATELLDRVREALEERAVASAGGFRLATFHYDRLPPLRSLIDDIIDRLADAALAAAPPRPIGPDGAPSPWLKAARELLQRREPPRPRGFPPSTHAEGLARLLDPSPPLLALVVRDEAPTPQSLLGLARAAEWLGARTGARVLLVLPDAMAANPALDSVNYDATHVQVRAPARVDPDNVATSRPRVAVSPLIGRPNPASRGEMMLAERLERDAELAGLFRFNVPVPTVRDTRPVVDLAWEEGRVVVEVDGYYYHSSEASFKNDRKRDYELLISGWVVLRLPHDEVVGDVERAVAMIRDVAAPRLASLRPSPEQPR